MPRWILLFVLGARCSCEDPLDEMYKTWQTRFNIDYVAENADRTARLAAFKRKVAKVKAQNMAEGIDCTDLFDGKDCIFRLNKWSDRTEEEFKSTMLGYKKSTTMLRGVHMNKSKYTIGPFVSSKDWRDEGVVTDIKNQNPCGVCWAFSATGTIESAVAIAGGGLQVLAVEQIIDCDGDGCDEGGDPAQAMQYVQKTGGLETNSEYPMTCCGGSSRTTGTCDWSGSGAATVTGVSYGPSDEDELAAAVASNGPYSIGVDATGWDSYSGGVSTTGGGCGTSLDHAVAIVGFDKTADTPYWIIRNQWGEDWGEDGYMYLAMGSNLCGLTTEPSIPSVSLSGVREVVV